MDPATAREVMEYLRNNPEAARAALQQAQQMQQRPGMAQQVCSTSFVTCMPCQRFFADIMLTAGTSRSLNRKTG